MTQGMIEIEMLSIDITNRCSKECSFCYNASRADRPGRWTADEVVDFASDCIAGGVKAISLGGGEPFEHPEIFEIITRLYPLAYLSVTTNGLPLELPEIKEKLLSARPDKIHISIHCPEDEVEVERVVKQLVWLQSVGVTPGVNLLVSKRNLAAARSAYSRLLDTLSPKQIILLPLRHSSDTPQAQDLFEVAGRKPFQSASCLTGCKSAGNFASVSWDKKAHWCSFSSGKAALPELSYRGLLEALGASGPTRGC